MTRAGVRRSAGIGLAFAISTVALAPASGTEADDPAREPSRVVAPSISIDVGDPGGVVRHVGFDIKQFSNRTAALTEDLARQIFSTGDYDVLRVPIIPQPGFVTAGHQLPDSNGVDTPGGTYLDPYIRFATWAKEYAPAGVDVRIFASLKTPVEVDDDNDRNDCGSWGRFDEGHRVCKAFSPFLHFRDSAAGAVDGRAYADYLASYLNEWHRAEAAVDVDILGPDNEGAGGLASRFDPMAWPNNDGQISAAKYEVIVERVDALLGAGEAPTPVMNFNDGKVPDLRTICTSPGLSTDAWARTGFLSFHYGAKRRLFGPVGGGNTGMPRLEVREYIKRLKQCETAHDPQNTKNTWDTEFHFTDGSEEYRLVAAGINALFDELNAGTNGVVWWGTPYPNSPGCATIERKHEDRRMMANLSTALQNGVPLGTSRSDAVSGLSFQAVRNGTDLWLLALTGANATPDDLIVRAAGVSISPGDHPGYQAFQWRTSSDGSIGTKACPVGKVQGISGQPDTLRLADLPDRSLTFVRIPGVFPQ